jgi:hypothetical protein
MNEGVGKVTVDSVNNYNGTLYQETWTADRCGYSSKALQFNGDQCIDIPDTIKPANVTLST